MSDSDMVAGILYNIHSYESTRLRCCLAEEDFKENYEACEYQTETVKTYTLNNDVCTEATCDRIDTNLPNDGSSRTFIFYKTGEICTPTGTKTVDKDSCCVIGQSNTAPMTYANNRATIGLYPITGSCLHLRRNIDYQ